MKDMRPIGEKLGDIDRQAREEIRNRESGTSGRGRSQSGRKEYETGSDPGDEERPEPDRMSER